MEQDSAPIAVGKKSDDLLSIVIDIVSKTQFKFLGMLLLIFIFINSDVFISRVLGRVSGAVDGKTTTSWGVCVQGIFLVLCMIAVDIFIRTDII